jgi:hypothetical protein
VSPVGYVVFRSFTSTHLSPLLSLLLFLSVGKGPQSTQLLLSWNHSRVPSIVISLHNDDFARLGSWWRFIEPLSGDQSCCVQSPASSRFSTPKNIKKIKKNIDVRVSVQQGVTQILDILAQMCLKPKTPPPLRPKKIPLKATHPPKKKQSLLSKIENLARQGL